MSFRRVVLAVAISVPLLGGVASADLQQDCWDNVHSFRVSALVCGRIPPGVG
jgi:hypothetical protein